LFGIKRWPPETDAALCLSTAAAAQPNSHARRFEMLHYAVVFFIIAIIAAVLGFGGIAAGAAGIAKILFIVFLVLAVASLIGGALRK